MRRGDTHRWRATGRDDPLGHWESIHMRVTRLENIEQCQAIAAAWDCLAHGNPFRRTAWLHSWWEHMRPAGELYVLQVTDAAGEVVGIAPWYLDHSLRQGRTVRPLGSGGVCSEYLGILSTTEHQQQVIAALAEWLCEAARGTLGMSSRWDLLDLVSVDTNDTVMQSFLHQLKSHGCHVHQRAAMSCWRAALPGSWKEYLAKLSKPYRKRSRRIVRTVLEPGVASPAHRIDSQRIPAGLGHPDRTASAAAGKPGAPGVFC